MLREVAFVRVYNVGERRLHGLCVAGLRPHKHRLRHTAGHIIHLELFTQRIKKGVRQRFNGIHAVHERREVPVAVCQEEFAERHRIDLHKVDLADGERGGLRKSYPQQRTGAGDVILRSVLAEIFHGIDDLRTVLHLVENYQRLLRQNFLPARQH